MAGEALAAWAATPQWAGLRRHPRDRKVSIYRNQSGLGLTCDRLTVTATGPGTVTAVREPADSDPPVPETYGGAALAALLTGMFTGGQL